jgi:hypothetical protein
LFVRDSSSDNGWRYKYLKKDAWNPQTERMEYEYNGMISSLKTDSDVTEDSDLEQEFEEKDSDDDDDDVSEGDEDARADLLLEDELDDEDGAAHSKWKKGIEKRCEKLEKELLLVWQRQKQELDRAQPKPAKSKRSTVLLYAVLLLGLLLFFYSLWSRVVALEQTSLKR